MIFFFFYNDTATTEIYTLSLHDALPIYHCCKGTAAFRHDQIGRNDAPLRAVVSDVINRCVFTMLDARSEEHTSELQSQSNLVCRLLLEKKKTRQYIYYVRLCVSAIISCK